MSNSRLLNSRMLKIHCNSIHLPKSIPRSLSRVIGLIDFINDWLLSENLSIVSTFLNFHLVGKYTNRRHVVSSRSKCTFMCGKDNANILPWTSSGPGALYGLMDMIELSTSAISITEFHSVFRLYFWCLGVLPYYLPCCHFA